MPDNDARCLAIDDLDIKWIGNGMTYGSSGGLIKYDGNNWFLYDTSNSDLPSNDIASITTDNVGNKWIGTYNAGLVKYNITNITIYNTSNTDLPDNYVRHITLDTLDNKWIGTGKGLAKFDGLNWTIYDTSNSELPDNNVNFVAIDQNGNKWIGTENGLAVFNENGIVSIGDKFTSIENIPNDYQIFQNYPNPFNPSTTIAFDLPETGQVTLKIFNILGEEVATLVSERLSAGSYSYEWDASDLASGVYLYRLQAGNYVKTRKMVVMK